MMRKTLMTAAAVALSASVANAAFLLGADDNDHKAVIVTQSQAEGTVSSFAAAIALERSGTVTPGFLLGADENDHKLWINQTAR
jgi:methionine-rich copper-binding protein CopC